MRGVYLQQQLEFRLEVAGDGWQQGDNLPCVLTVKNHAGAKRSLADLSLRLAVGDQKKAKQKAEGAFDVVASAELQAGELEPQQQAVCNWTFALDKNCVITDNVQSLYLLYGTTPIPDTSGQLPVTVKPHPHIQVVFRILETAFNFVPKAQKSSKGWVNGKFKAPSAKKFATLNELTLGARFDGDVLVLRYQFNLKKFEATPSTVGVKKEKSELEQRFEPAQYLFPGGMVNHEPLEAAIADALETVASGF